jgi:hypothetical protein
MCFRSAKAVAVGIALLASGTGGAFADTATLPPRNGDQIPSRHRVEDAHSKDLRCAGRDVARNTARVSGGSRPCHRVSGGGSKRAHQLPWHSAFNNAPPFPVHGPAFLALSSGYSTSFGAAQPSVPFLYANTGPAVAGVNENIGAKPNAAQAAASEPPSEFKLVGGLGMPANRLSDSPVPQYRSITPSDNDTVSEKLTNSLWLQGVQLGFKLRY